MSEASSTKVPQLVIHVGSQRIERADAVQGWLWCPRGGFGVLGLGGSGNPPEVRGTAHASLTMMISMGMGIRIFFMYLRLSSLTTIRSTALTKA